MSVRDEIAAALTSAARELGAAGELPDLEVGRARNPEHGDYASPVGMKLARLLRRPPPEIAADIAMRTRLAGGAATAEAAGGYVNFRLAPTWLQALVGEVAAAEGYGRSTAGAGERVQVEFGSINPTGPMHIGHGRGSILGDSLARLLAFTGHTVEREYYVNDYNTQAWKFGESIYARLHGEQPPEGGYLGDYVLDLAEAARKEIPGVAGLPRDEAVDKLREFGAWQVIEASRATLERLGIEYDRWFSERGLWDEGLPQAAIERLRAGGHLIEREGALWFAPAFEEGAHEDEDRVVIRSTGQPTYFASDLGYLLSRFEQRGFERVIEVWGADHHGYVPRFKAGAAALGIDPERLEVLIHQAVGLREGRMSKRAGRFVPIDQLIDQVGPDAVRFFYLLRSAEVTIEFDLELAVQHDRANPVYYAQYAHARLAGVELVAAERHASLPPPDLELLAGEAELDLARQLAFWPDAALEAARLREPHRVAYYAGELADRIHKFYDRGNRDGALRVVVDDPGLTAARLELCRAARGTLRTVLDLLGVSAPDKM